MTPSTLEGLGLGMPRAGKDLRNQVQPLATAAPPFTDGETRPPRKPGRSKHPLFQTGILEDVVAAELMTPKTVSKVVCFSLSFLVLIESLTSVRFLTRPP